MQNKKLFKQEVVSQVFKGICEFNSIQNAAIADMPEEIIIKYGDGTIDTLKREHVRNRTRNEVRQMDGNRLCPQK